LLSGGGPLARVPRGRCHARPPGPALQCPFSRRCQATQRKCLHIPISDLSRTLTTGQPMRDPTFHVLVAMLDGPLDGYGITRRAHKRTDGRVGLAAGTLYAALDRLRDTGLIDIDQGEIMDGRARRYYRLTGAGREALRTEARRMARAAKLVLRQAGAP